MTKMPQTGLPFAKMHGAGNDFVVIDTRSVAVSMTANLACAMGDRHRGVGFDQLAVIENTDAADLRLTFWNSDGSISAACGNATRCIATQEMAFNDATHLKIEVADRMLAAKRDDDQTWVNMGHALTSWDQIPLAHEVDTDQITLTDKATKQTLAAGRVMATSMGNPHCTVFVQSIEAYLLEELGPKIEHDPLFPERTNFQIAEQRGADTFRVLVWERGVGRTLASGSSSCAVAHAAYRSGQSGPNVTLEMDGGTLNARVTDEGIWLTGPTQHVYDGLWRV